MADLRYPIGPYDAPEHLSAADIAQAISEIAAAPAQLRAAVAGLDDTQLDTPYRPDGWTVRQVVHHVPDSHLNAYLRIKLALTEEKPLVRVYDETRWARLDEAQNGDVEMSLMLLDALHQRWVASLRTLDAEQLERTLTHPEWGDLTVDRTLHHYAWHGRHHVAHVTSLRERQGWR